MDLSCDTSSGRQFRALSALSGEDLEEVIATDWWFDSGMPKRPKKPDQDTAGLPDVVTRAEFTAQTATLNSIKKQIDSPDATSRESMSWRSSPWLVAIASALLSGVLCFWIAQWQLGKQHAGDNQDRDISLEVAKQLRPLDERLIAIEVMLKLGSFAEGGQITERRLPLLKDAVEQAQRRGVVVPTATLDAVRATLVHANIESPAFWSTATALINYSGYIKGKTDSSVRAAELRPCFKDWSSPASIEGEENAAILMNGCAQKIDGIRLSDITFRDGFIIYDGGPLNLRNVKFVNCVFRISLPRNPADPAKRLTETILSQDSGPTPVFSISTLS